MGVICSSVVDVKKVARQDVNAPKVAFVVGLCVNVKDRVQIMKCSVIE